MSAGEPPAPGERSLARIHRRRWDVPGLLALSAVMLFFGLTLPLVRVEKMVFWENEYSVATGVFGLYQDGEYFLAALVFFFSVIFPIAKLTLLFWIWFVPMGKNQRKATLHRLEAMGRWSMLDVFIVAILVVATKLGALADVEALPGVYYFAAAILTSMIATPLIQRLSKRA